jgi:hypothetical protein
MGMSLNIFGAISVVMELTGPFAFSSIVLNTSLSLVKPYKMQHIRRRPLTHPPQLSAMVLTTAENGGSQNEGGEI